MKQILFLLISHQFLTATIGYSQTTNKAVDVEIFQYDFGAGAEPGFIKVKPSSIYSDKAGFGFEPGSKIKHVIRSSRNLEHDGFATSNEPFFFSVKIPEGNYNVKVTAGDIQGMSDLAIRAECRRMMVERVSTSANEIKTIEFTVHVRDTIIRSTNTRVRIKDRERAYRHWDNKLTLEFNGSAPKINSIAITPAANDVITIFLAGNSTVVDQDREPYAAWGQMIPAFFEPGKLAVANYAESGESLSSFIAAKRLGKILALMKPGDYAFVEFGHNDQKQKGEGIGAFTSYKKDLKYFISEVKARGGIPVLVTSMHRRNFDSATGKVNQTLGDYPEAVRQTAREENVALIDLNAMSKILYEAWGVEDSKKAFVIYPANTFPGQTTELKDNTHFNPYGAFEIARCIVKGIQDNNFSLAKFLRKDLSSFDPAKPDPVSKLYWPLSPSFATVKPDGN